MGSTGSVSRPSEGLLLGMVQYPVPKLTNRADIEANIDTICEATANTKAGYPGMDLIVWPAYSTQGLNFRKWVSEDFLLQVEDPAFQKFAQTCKESDIWGVFSLIERNPDPDQMPFKSAVIFNNHGELVLKYRMLNPWVPRGPWTPGDLGVPVCKGPGGSVLALCINNDGMFPEHAREAAYKGCNVYIRISAHSSQVKEQWEVTNRSNAWHNLMYTASINLSGYDGIFSYFGGGEVCNFDGHTIVQSQRNPWEIVTAEIYPRMADQARRDWALDNNILNLGSRGYVAVPGGVKECPYSWITDFAKGAYKVPWEDEVKVKDGSFYGYPTHGGRFGRHE